MAYSADLHLLNYNYWFTSTLRLTELDEIRMKYRFLLKEIF